MISVSRIRVFIVDDQDVVIFGVKDILKDHDDLEIVGHQTNVEALVINIAATKPDVVLLDVKMNGFNVFETIEAINAVFRQDGKKQPAIILVTSLLDAYLASKAQDMGVSGYLLKEDGLSNTLAGAIRLVFEGGWAYSSAVQEQLSSPNGKSTRIKLTPGEDLILSLMVDGYSTEEIVKIVDKSHRAIYSVQHRIRNKLGVDTNPQAIVKAIQDKIVPIGRSGRLGHLTI